MEIENLTEEVIILFEALVAIRDGVPDPCAYAAEIIESVCPSN